MCSLFAQLTNFIVLIDLVDQRLKAVLVTNKRRLLCLKIVQPFKKRLSTRSMTKKVRIVEVGPRDGLQNEKQLIDTQVKVELVNRLKDAGCKYIEVGSFVSPKAVPRMADSGEVFKLIERDPGVTYAALTPNLKGFEGIGQKFVCVK